MAMIKLAKVDLQVRDLHFQIKLYCVLMDIFMLYLNYFVHWKELVLKGVEL